MPRPVRSLPTIQNWDCHGCSDCCRTYVVRVTAGEREKLLKQTWEDVPELAGVEPCYYDHTIKDYRLSHTPDGACVFLGPDNRCRIHGKYGSAAKPMACRIYPFILTPAGDHWRVGVRFACPSVADNKGRGLAAHKDDLNEYAGLIEADTPGVMTGEAPELQSGQRVPWADLFRFTHALSAMIGDRTHPIERRLRHVIALAEVCKKSKFDKVTGNRLDEFLQVIAGATADDVPADPYAVPSPTWVGRMLFRQHAAVYARKDNGPDAGIASHGWWTRVYSAWRFAVGSGNVPRLHARIPATATFEKVEQPAGELPTEADDLLTRYYRVKLESLQFFGVYNFRRHFWGGLDSLLLTFPVILWIARLFEMNGEPRAEAILRAVRLVDDSFGFNKLLGGARVTWMVTALADRGEVARLIAWAAR